MRFTLVSGPTVRRIIDSRRSDIVDVVRATYIEHHRGRSVNPRSHFLRFPEKPDARIIALPAFLADHDLAGIKWISSFPQNVERNVARASSVLVLNDYATGYPFACLESSHISAARTAASAVLAAECVVGSRAVERVLFVGAGVLARTIADFLLDQQWEIAECEMFDLETRYAQALSSHVGSAGVEARAVTDVSAALGRADLVVLATTAASPWLTDPSWLRPGQCILNISLRDLAPEVILEAHNFVDDIDHCLTANTSPHLAEQAVGHRRFIDGTIAEMLLGEVKTEADRPRIVSPFGLGVLDLAVGEHVHRVASLDGAVTSVPDFFGPVERWEGA
ncbi:2,3-diaminopropionate biosynthesis protein SbnB [Streptosporangium sp. NPDC051022]|uniref:2,3-diaminopropionate biosynthesis protein SbnB n=1 Tax=Streptosporangium sp. NPDC051022 TaxID=3155752 RepID=UPI0034239DE0